MKGYPDERNVIFQLHREESTPVIELAVVIPTLNEAQNVSAVIEGLNAALDGISWEAIFVDDDSQDGTAERLLAIAQQDPRIRVLRRVGRRGLASACLEGMLSTAAPYIAVMDGDLQHDENTLRVMLSQIRSQRLDLVVATRNSAGGSMGDFSCSRVRLSRLGERLSRAISHCPLSDPMSGFFLLDRRFFEEVVGSVSGIGFKILLDLVASSKRPVRFAEVPYTFRNRLHGQTKLDILVGIEYLQLLLDKLVGSILPPRFLLFAMVGGIGAVVHLATLFLTLELARQPFAISQTVAAFVAMTGNFFLNNTITYRDRRLRGLAFVYGLLSFYLACSVGALLNIRVAMLVLSGHAPWYLAGAVGLIVGSVWNYAVTAILTWRQGRARIAARRRSALRAATDQQSCVASSSLR